MRTPTPPKKEPKERSGAQKRATLENLRKANIARETKQRKKKLFEIDTGLKDLSGKIDDKVAEQVEARLRKLDRGKLKDEVLQVFYDMGGAKALKRWAKDNPTKYYSMMTAIIKAEAESSGGGGRGVTVNVFGGRASREKDVTPVVEVNAG